MWNKINKYIKQKDYEKLLFLSLLLSAVFCLSSCGSDSDDNDAVAYIENPVLGKVAVDISSTETTPEWLSTMIKKMDADKDMYGSHSIFKGEWQGQTIYFVYSPLASCVFCEVYYADGKHIDWNAEDAASFNKATKNWRCIYNGYNAASGK